LRKIVKKCGKYRDKINNIKELLMKKIITFAAMVCCLVSSAIYAAEDDPNTYADKLPTIPKNARIAILPIAYDFAAVPQEIPIVQEAITSQIKELGLTPFAIKFDAASTPKDTIQLFMLSNSTHEKIRPAKQEFISNLKGQANYDIVLIPAVVSRTAKLAGQMAVWDNVKTRLTIKGFGSGESMEWSGSRLGLSLELDAYDANGNWVFTSYGGISIPYAINTREAVNELKPRLFEAKKDQDTLQKGVEVALEPLTKKIKISKELRSAESAPVENEVNLKVEPANAVAQLNEGMRYYAGHGVAKDYKQAIHWFTQSAEQGNVIAQATLGYIYLKGEGVPQDHAQAMQWLKKAAEQDDTDAQRNLGALYLGRDDASRDTKQALFWLTKAAEKGDLIAQYNLGVLYQKTKDSKQAVSWFSKAANLGNPNAQMSLGRMYANGEGLPQDYKQAYIWSALAATNGMNSRNRDLAAAKLSPQVLAEAQKETKELFDKIDANKPKK
jgi:tetratricopeptide (TPR) repeat protein